MQKFKGYKVRMYPTKEQEEQLLAYCRVSRYAYNWALFKHNEIYKETGKITTSNELCKLFTEFKNSEDSPLHIWLRSFKATALRIAVRNVAMEFKKCFKRRKSSPWLHTGLPKPITKKSGHNFFFTRKERMFIYKDNVSFEGFTTRDNNAIQLKKHNIPIDKKYNYCDPCISQDNMGRWWFSCEIDFGEPKEITKFQIHGEPIGIDLGIKHFVTTSDGDIYDYPKEKIEKLEKKLKQKQRRLNKIYDKEREERARTKSDDVEFKRSSNTQKKLKEMRKLYDKIANIRKNTRYEIANAILDKNPRAVVMEGLNVTGMMKNRHISTKVQNNGFYEFRKIMEYKCDWNDIEFILADQWFPSSKTCSHCGSVNKGLTIRHRTFVCPVCGYEIDRDVNAAINLRNLANIVI
jgi:putative transposase